MIRDMIRKKQLLDDAACEAVLKRNTNGIMAVMGDEDYPYGVPLSFVWHDGKIYFHTGNHGYKLECIRKNPKVSFTVVDKDEIVEEEYTSYFRSVIILGRARETEGAEKLAAFKAMADKYSPSMAEDARMKEVSECREALIIAIDVDHMTGKEAIEIVRARKKECMD